MTKNSSKSFISSKRDLMEILPNGLCSLWLNRWMTGLICLRWSTISPIDESARTEIILTVDPLSTITRETGLLPKIPKI